MVAERCVSKSGAVSADPHHTCRYGSSPAAHRLVVPALSFPSDREPSLYHRSRLANFCVLSSMSTAMPRFESSRPSHEIVSLFETLGATSEFWLSVRRGTGELLACRFLRIGAMNHHVFAVVVARQQLENTLKHPAFRPKIEALVDDFQSLKRSAKIGPWRQTPKSRSLSSCSRYGRRGRTQQMPRVRAQFRSNRKPWKNKRLAGWGARIRTWEWRNQNPLHLTISLWRRTIARLGTVACLSFQPGGAPDNRLRPSANRVKTIKACSSAGEEISPFRRACTPRKQLAGTPEHRVAEANLVRREVAFNH